jgi:hypothetical protein
MGAGTLGRRWLPIIREFPWCEVTGFADNDLTKQGKYIDDLQIQKPTREYLSGAQVLLLGSMYKKDLLRQLSELGLANRAALTPTDMMRRFGPKVARTNERETLPPGKWKYAHDILGPGIDEFDKKKVGKKQAVTGFTVCTNRMLNQAWALADSFLQLYPNSNFHLFLADRREESLAYPDSFDPRIRTEEAAALEVPEFDYLTLAYDAFELCCALKPFIAREMVQRCPGRIIVYFDSDIFITGDLDPVLETAANGGWALTPHRLTPAKSAEEELGFLRCGTLNLGFFALSDCPLSRGLLDWWASRLLSHCVCVPSQSLFVDQKWMDLAICFHNKARILFDPGCNVGYWNLDERELAVEPDGFTINGLPLRFFHFSGYDPVDPKRLTQHRDAGRPVSGALQTLLATYAASVARVDSQDLPTVHRYGMREGRLLPRSWRIAFREWTDGRFTQVDFGSFVQWLRRPAQPGSPFPRAFEICAVDALGLGCFEKRHEREAVDFLLQVDALMGWNDLSDWLPEAIDGGRLAETLEESA